MDVTQALEHLGWPSREEIDAFGVHWYMADLMPKHGVTHLCAVYEPEAEDGKRVEVWRTAVPAVFYTIQWDGHTLGTGSGEMQLAISIAKAVSTGMLGIASRKE